MTAAAIAPTTNKMTLSTMIAQEKQNAQNVQQETVKRLNRFASIGVEILRESLGNLWDDEFKAYAKPPVVKQDAFYKGVQCGIEINHPNLLPFCILCNIVVATPSDRGATSKFERDWECNRFVLQTGEMDKPRSGSGEIIAIYQGTPLWTSASTNEEALTKYFHANATELERLTREAAIKNYQSKAERLINAARTHGPVAAPSDIHKWADELRVLRQPKYPLLGPTPGHTIEHLESVAIQRHQTNVEFQARQQEREVREKQELATWGVTVENWMRTVCDTHGRNLDRVKEVRDIVDGIQHTIYELTFALIAYDAEGDPNVTSDEVYVTSDKPDAEGFFEVLYPDTPRVRRMQFKHLVSIEQLPPLPESRLGYNGRSYHGLQSSVTLYGGVLDTFSQRLPNKGDDYPSSIAHVAPITPRSVIISMLQDAGVEPLPAIPNMPSTPGANDVFYNVTNRVIAEYEAAWQGKEYAEPKQRATTRHPDDIDGFDDPFAE